MGLPGMTDAAHEPGLAALPAELLQAFVALSRDMLAMTDATGTVLWANSRFAAATGYAGRRGDEPARFHDPGQRRLRGAAVVRAHAQLAGVRQRRAPVAEPGRRAVLGRGPFGTCRRPHHLDARGRDAPARARRARGAPGRAARHRAGVRPARHLGTRDSVRRRPLGQARVRLLGNRSGRGNAAPRRRARARSSRGSRARGLPRFDAPRRPLLRSAIASCSATARRAGSTRSGR